MSLTITRDKPLDEGLLVAGGAPVKVPTGYEMNEYGAVVKAPGGTHPAPTTQPATTQPATNTVQRNTGLLSGSSPAVTQAVTQGVTQDQTVQHQLSNILAKDSPLMQRAATVGKQYANSRGLLNSSMAAEASQAAMIDRATPIAQQDAGTYANQALTNQNWQNQFGAQSNDFAYNSALQASELASRQQIAGMQIQAAADLQSTELDWRTSDTQARFDYSTLEREDQQAFDTIQRDLDRKTQELLNSNTLTASQANTITSGTMNSVSAILSNPDLKAAEKQYALDNVYGSANSQIKFLNDLNGTNIPFFNV